MYDKIHYKLKKKKFKKKKKESDTTEQLSVPVLPPSKRESCIKSLPLQQVPYAYQLTSSNDPGALPAVASVLGL